MRKFLLLMSLSLAAAAPVAAESLLVPPDNPALVYSARIDRSAPGRASLSWSGARIRLRFTGSSVALRMTDDTGETYLRAWVDGRPLPKVHVGAAKGLVTLASGLSAGEHTVEVVRITEGMQGLSHFEGFVLDADAKTLPWPAGPDRRLLFIGDSITCGYGVESDDPAEHFSPSTEDFCQGYTGLTIAALQADYLVVSRSGIGMVRDYDGPYEGNDDAMPLIYDRMLYGRATPAWNPADFTPQVICINLGTNDHSTTGVNREKYTTTYLHFADKLLSQYPKAKLVLLQGPMNNSKPLHEDLQKVLAGLRAKHGDRVNFLELSAQGELGYGADSHPNRRQSKRNAAELTAYLRGLMGW
jgi:lysophospholipase L1-like esterase